MKRIAASMLAVGTATIIVVVLAGRFGGAVAQPAERSGAGSSDRAHFNHLEHADHLGKEKMAKCETCHSLDASAKPIAPAGAGHSPCLDAKCHAEVFLSVSEKNKQAAEKDPKKMEAFTKATKFCLACHEGIPWPWKKPVVRVLQGWENQREHHIEMARSEKSTMDHYMHATTAKTKDGIAVGCRDCHAIGDDFKLIKGAPGHAQCVKCHSKAQGVAFAMTECSRCHKAGSREDYLRKLLEDNGKTLHEKEVPSRPGSDVRACGSDGDDKQKKKKGKVPCFKHDTKEHRESKTGDGIQCRQCHWIVVEKKKWGKDKAGKPFTFSSAGDLHLNKIIGDSRTGQSEQHKACAGCHPHKAQVELASANCQYCHAERTAKEPYW